MGCNFSAIQEGVLQQIAEASGKVMVGDHAVSIDAARAIAMRAARDAVTATVEGMRAEREQRSLRPEFVFLAAAILRRGAYARSAALEEAMALGAEFLRVVNEVETEE